MFVFIVGNSVTDADKKVAVLGVKFPIIVLLIVVLVTGIFEPVVPIVPVTISFTVIIRPSVPDSSSVDKDASLGLSNSSAVTVRLQKDL